MLTADALTRLRAYQTQVLMQMDGVAALLDLSPEAARSPLARTRWAMARLLREYQLFKHGEIFDPVLRHGTGYQVTLASRMRVACLAAGEQFAAHVAHWSTRDIVAAWAEYRATLEAMIDGMRRHIAREAAEMETLLAGSTRIRPSPLPSAVMSPARSLPAAHGDSRAP